MIILTVKLGKPSTMQCSPFRPTSLTGADTKILCKPSFIMTRMFFVQNIGGVLQIISEKHNTLDIALLSPDDRIEWPYFLVLHRFGLEKTS